MPSAILVNSIRRKHHHRTFKSMASTTPNIDRLSAPAPELLIKIIAELPLRFYLNLKHTSRFFREFLKEHASAICNYAVESRFLYQAKLLNSVHVSGWLVPTHARICTLDKVFGMWTTMEAERKYHRGAKYLHLGGEWTVDQEQPLKVTDPGPQYLCLLGWKMVWKKGDPVNRTCQKNPNRLSHIWGPDGLDVDEFAFKSLVKRMNRMVMTIDGTVCGQEVRFPRELIWYYGVERLQLITN